MKKIFTLLIFINSLFLSGCSFYSRSNDINDLEFFSHAESIKNDPKVGRTYVFTYNKGYPCKGDRPKDFPRIYENKEGKLYVVTYPEDNYNNNKWVNIYGVNHEFEKKYEKKCDSYYCENEINLQKCGNHLLCGNSDSGFLIKMNDCDHADYYVEFIDYNWGIRRLENGINNYNSALVSEVIGSIPKQFVTDKFLVQTKQAVDKATTLNELEETKKSAVVLGYNEKISFIIQKKYNEINFNTNYDYYLTRASVNELNRILSNKSLLNGVQKSKINKVQKVRDNKELQSILGSSSVPYVKKYLNSHPKNSQVRDRLVKLYRHKNSFSGFINAYNTSKEKSDLKEAFRLANSKSDKLVVEKMLVENAPISNIFQVRDISTHSTGIDVVNLAGKYIPIMQNISEITGGTQKVTKEFEIFSKIPLVGMYEISVNFEHIISFSVKTNALPGWIGAIASAMTQSKSEDHVVKFKLNPSNKYKDTKSITFSTTSVKTSALGLHMSSKIVGSKIKVHMTQVNQL